MPLTQQSLPGTTERPHVWITPIAPASDSLETILILSEPLYRQYLFIHSGGGEADLDGWRTSLAAGEILFIPSRSHGNIALRADIRAMLFGVADDFLLSRVVPALGVSVAPFWDNFHSPKKLSHWTSPAEAPDRERLWSELLLARRRLGTPCDAAVAAYVMLTLFEKNNHPRDEWDVAPRVASASEEMPNSGLDLVGRFRGLIEQQLASDWQISDYCKVLDVRPAQLTQACKAVLGCTPVSIIHDQKLLHAKRHLTYSRTSAAEIAYQLGFSDPAYFSRFFRRHTGRSPVEFRRAAS
jgi:AraC family transcriptional activator of pobA